MAAMPFPHRYETALSLETAWPATLSSPPRPGIQAGPPPEFGGQDGWWSPEHLLLSAAALCLMATFKALAARARLTVHSYKSRAQGTVDKTGGGIAFTAIALQVEMSVPAADAQRSRDLLHTAEKHCIVANSLKVPVTVEARVVSPDAGPSCPPEATRRSLS